MRRKLIVVSNRGPVSFARGEAGERVALRGGGGLATALRGLIQQHDVTWVASAMSEEDRLVASERGGGAGEERLDSGAPYRLRLVAHDPRTYELYYDVVANGTLWFLQHYLWGLASEPDLGPDFLAAWRDGYEVVNHAFADAVTEELDREPGAAVWFHDYHLYLAPGLVRSRHPDSRLSHFIHVPWTQPDYWKVLPAELRQAVHESLCANDVVGFHTERWRRNFVECCAESGCTTETTAHAIGIDASEFDALTESSDVLAEEAKITASRPELLVVRVDRTDPSKNIVRGFRAFALMLEQHRELVGRVGMLALLDPSRQSLPVYARYVREIEEAVRTVNARFGEGSYRPIEMQIADNFPQSVAAYKQFDVLLVNAVYDGMNLVAKEGPLVNRRDGVVVLSENAGASEELGSWALRVNPFDLQAQADALFAGLTMAPAERAERAAAIRTHVREHGIEEWTAVQLSDLDRRASTITSS